MSDYDQFGNAIQGLMRAVSVLVWTLVLAVVCLAISLARNIFH